MPVARSAPACCSRVPGSSPLDLIEIAASPATPRTDASGIQCHLRLALTVGSADLNALMVPVASRLRPTP